MLIMMQAAITTMTCKVLEMRVEVRKSCKLNADVTIPAYKVMRNRKIANAGRASKILGAGPEVVGRGFFLVQTSYCSSNIKGWGCISTEHAH